MDENDTRLERLEIRMAYLEKTLEDLSQVVLEQAKDSGQIEKKLDALIGLYRQLKEDGQPDMPGDIRPPHY